MRLIGSTALGAAGLVVAIALAPGFRAAAAEPQAGSVTDGTPPATAASSKSGPRTLSEAELATLRQRIQGDRVRRAEALDREQAAAEQQRRQFEQMQQMAAAEEYWEEEVSAPAPNLAEVFLGTLSSELANHQVQREAQDAFIRDIERQQRAAVERRQREEERQRREAERVRQLQHAQTATAPSASVRAAQDGGIAARAREAEARDRELATQAAAERARLQQVRARQQAAVTSASASTAPSPAATAAVKPLRFILTIGLLNKPGDTVNPTCYSNVITRPGPPGWGGTGFLPQGSGDQAHAMVQSMRDAFIARCRASGREVTSVGNFNYVWNRSKGEEDLMEGTRPRFREDVAVSL